MKKNSQVLSSGPNLVPLTLTSGNHEFLTKADQQNFSAVMVLITSYKTQTKANTQKNQSLMIR